MISALAGRALTGGEPKLMLFAVGDDDQNICLRQTDLRGESPATGTISSRWAAFANASGSPLKWRAKTPRSSVACGHRRIGARRAENVLDAGMLDEVFDSRQ